MLRTDNRRRVVSITHKQGKVKWKLDATNQIQSEDILVLVPSSKTMTSSIIFFSRK